MICDQCNRTNSLPHTAKKQKILLLCVKLLSTEQAPIRQVGQLLGTFSSSFIGVPYGKLYYRFLERSKAKSLIISKGNFDKIIYVSKEAIHDILSWKHNIIYAYAPIVRKNLSIITTTDVSSFGQEASLGKNETGGHYQQKKFNNTLMFQSLKLLGLA